jgi:endonuclease YncB( thermonuclease family)
VAKGDWEKLENCRLVSSFLNDGDSFLVEHDGEEFVIRLYFVDTMEVSMSYPDRVRDQGEYFDISDEDTLELGEAGAKFTEKFLRGRFTVYTRRRTGGGYGIRYLSLIEKNGEDLGEALVRNGLARVFGYPTLKKPPGLPDASRMKQRLLAQERAAKRDEFGGWGSLRPGSRQSAQLVDDESLDGNAASRANEIPVVSINTGGKLDINTASALAMQEVRGIGPVLSGRIVAMRPYESIEDLARVSGISDQTVERLSAYLAVVELEPPEYTASYYLKKPEEWRNREIAISIQKVEAQILPAPDGFAVVKAQTNYEGRDGGSILVFLPEDRVDLAIERFDASASPIMTNLLFYNYRGTDILVVQQ